MEQARLKTEAAEIESQSELNRLTEARNAELLYQKESNNVEIAKTKDMAMSRYHMAFLLACQSTF